MQLKHICCNCLSSLFISFDSYFIFTSHFFLFKLLHSLVSFFLHGQREFIHFRAEPLTLLAALEVPEKKITCILCFMGCSILFYSMFAVWLLPVFQGLVRSCGRGFHGWRMARRVLRLQCQRLSGGYQWRSSGQMKWQLMKIQSSFLSSWQGAPPHLRIG